MTAPAREGWKLLAWYQDGNRTLTREQGNADPTDDVTSEFHRMRWGLGTTIRKGKFRGEFEHISAEGMIFTATDGGAVAGSTATVAGSTALASFNFAPDDKAGGWHADFGFRFHTKWEVDARYGLLNRATKTGAGERKFETLSLGLQCFLHKQLPHP
ncbi:MAG: hypothetical protein JSW10_03090 [Pseudomonadota bacterium]|nr:MAG: hypothetical protein JSW10_03090 [Pseudomonadota bacterium]